MNIQAAKCRITANSMETGYINNSRSASASSSVARYSYNLHDAGYPGYYFYPRHYRRKRSDSSEEDRSSSFSELAFVR